MLNWLVKICPILAAILYTVVGSSYGLKKDWSWCLVWLSYALANIGLVLAAMEKTVK